MTAWYLVITLVMTWPLAAGLTRDLPSDLGDPLFVCWILGWVDDHLTRFLSGDASALRAFWDTNIFYPERLTLAYSEHLTAQAIQALPVFVATRNLLLCYNLLFLSTFVLSALGMYLLVRELTGSARAGFVAGLLYGFAPYRIGQFPHLQVLSSQWMPFVLYGLRRYFESRRLLPLAGAALALVAQNLSSAYYLVFFAPFVAAYILYEAADRGLLRDRRVWAALVTVTLVVALVTWPFVAPYMELRALGFTGRPVEEVRGYSADVYSYLTAHWNQHAWGWLRIHPKSEGDLFPSAVPVILAAVAVLGHITRVKELGDLRTLPSRRRRVTVFALWVALACVLGAVLILTTGGLMWSIGPMPLRATNPLRALRHATLAALVALLVAPPVRAWVRGVPRSLIGFAVVAAILAFWLSLGPSPESLGRRLVGAGAYTLLYEYVPGFSGLRVPARFAMIFVLFLTVLAGYGAAEIERRGRRGAAIVLVSGLLFLAEATAAPIPLNRVGSEEGVVTPPPRVETGSEVPEVYRFLRSLPPGAVVVEFPFGAWVYEIRYVYYSTEHWRPLVNGYSSVFPKSYMDKRGALRGVLADPERAWHVLSRSGATHAIVHEGAFPLGDGAPVTTWLQRRGAWEIEAFGTDKVFQLPRR